MSLDKDTIEWATNRVLSAKYRGIIEGDQASEIIQMLEDPDYTPGGEEDDDEYAEDEEDEDNDEEE